MDARARFALRRSLAAALGLAATTGCSLGPSDRSDSLERQLARQEQETAETLTVRLSEFALRFAAVTESAADEIIARSQDEDVRREALRWKAEAIPASFLTSFRPNPVGATLDTWALCVQLDEYFRTGDGRSRFGDHQEVALEATRELLDAIEETVSVAAEAQAEVRELKEDVRALAAEMPIEGSISSRRSPAERFPQYTGTHEGLITTIEDLQSQLWRLERRTQIYLAHVPKQIQWQGELVVRSVLENPTVVTVSTSLDSLRTSAREISEFLLEIEALLDRERIAALAEVNTIVDDAVRDVFARVDSRTQSLLPWVVLGSAVPCLLLAVLVWVVARRRTVQVQVLESGRPRPPASPPGDAS